METGVLAGGRPARRPSRGPRPGRTRGGEEKPPREDGGETGTTAFPLVGHDAPKLNRVTVCFASKTLEKAFCLDRQWSSSEQYHRRMLFRFVLVAGTMSRIGWRPTADASSQEWTVYCASLGLYALLFVLFFLAGRSLPFCRRWGRAMILFSFVTHSAVVLFYMQQTVSATHYARGVISTLVFLPLRADFLPPTIIALLFIAALDACLIFVPMHADAMLATEWPLLLIAISAIPVFIVLFREYPKRDRILFAALRKSARRYRSGLAILRQLLPADLAGHLILRADEQALHAPVVLRHGVILSVCIVGHSLLDGSDGAASPSLIARARNASCLLSDIDRLRATNSQFHRVERVEMTVEHYICLVRPSKATPKGQEGASAMSHALDFADQLNHELVMAHGGVLEFRISIAASSLCGGLAGGLSGRSFLVWGPAMPRALALGDGTYGDCNGDIVVDQVAALLVPRSHPLRAQLTPASDGVYVLADPSRPRVPQSSWPSLDAHSPALTDESTGTPSASGLSLVSTTDSFSSDGGRRRTIVSVDGDRTEVSILAISRLPADVKAFRLAIQGATDGFNVLWHGHFAHRGLERAFQEHDLRATVVRTTVLFASQMAIHAIMLLYSLLSPEYDRSQRTAAVLLHLMALVVDISQLTALHLFPRRFARHWFLSLVVPLCTSVALVLPLHFIAVGYEAARGIGVLAIAIAIAETSLVMPFLPGIALSVFLVLVLYLPAAIVMRAANSRSAEDERDFSRIISDTTNLLACAVFLAYFSFLITRSARNGFAMRIRAALCEQRIHTIVRSLMPDAVHDHMLALFERLAGDDEVDEVRAGDQVELPAVRQPVHAYEPSAADGNELLVRLSWAVDSFDDALVMTIAIVEDSLPVMTPSGSSGQFLTISKLFAAVNATRPVFDIAGAHSVYSTCLNIVVTVPTAVPSKEAPLPLQTLVDGALRVIAEADLLGIQLRVGIGSGLVLSALLGSVDCPVLRSWGPAHAQSAGLVRMAQANTIALAPVHAADIAPSFQFDVVDDAAGRHIEIDGTTTILHVE